MTGCRFRVLLVCPRGDHSDKDEQKAVYADYRAINETPGRRTGRGVALGSIVPVDSVS